MTQNLCPPPLGIGTPCGMMGVCKLCPGTTPDGVFWRGMSCTQIGHWSLSSALRPHAPNLTEPVFSKMGTRCGVVLWVGLRVLCEI